MSKDIGTHNHVTFKAHHPFLTLNYSNGYLIHQTWNIVVCIISNIPKKYAVIQVGNQT
jgi:hypothetical protein